jgi:malonyl-CoA decarboxylase
MNSGEKMETSRTLRDVLQGLGGLWRGISLSRDGERDFEFQPDLPGDQRDRLRQLMRDCLEERGGEISARVRAAQLGRAYISMTAEGRQRFLELLVHEFPPDAENLRNLARRMLDSGDPESFLEAQQRMNEAMASPGLRLLSHFNILPAGVKFLIDLRADLLEWAGEDKRLAHLSHELRGLLATWFDLGFLRLQRITWESSAALLEKLIAYEAVHEIHSWTDLRNRLESDRRCYAFFHPALADEPLIFIEIALVEGLAGSIQDLLDPSAPEVDPQTADAAIFYSISNAQKGLRGISFGNFLIKQVVDDLRRDFPDLKTFATLSPIPGFARWLQQVWDDEKDDPLVETLRRAVSDAAARLETEATFQAVVSCLGWWEDEQVVEWLQEPLERLCLRYFHQKRSDGFPLDPVQRFHLGNGARIERINWLGDLSPKGMRQSCGLMVNYRYKLEEMEKNHEAYTGEQRIVLSRKLRSRLDAQERDRGALLGLWKGR